MKLVDIMPVEKWVEVEKTVTEIIREFRADSGGVN